MCRICAREASRLVREHAEEFVEPGHYTFHTTGTYLCEIARGNNWPDEDWDVLPCDRASVTIMDPLLYYRTDEFGRCARHRKILSSEKSVDSLPLAKELYRKLNLPSDGVNGRELLRRADILAATLPRDTEGAALQ
jgi:hypothetical protein